MRRHQPSLPNKNPFVPFFSLLHGWQVWVLACWGCGHPPPISLISLGSQACHWLYALKSRGETIKSTPLFSISKVWQAHHGMACTHGFFVLFIYTTPTLIKLGFLLLFKGASRENQSYVLAWPWMYETYSYVMSPLRTQWCACNKGTKASHNNTGEYVACLIIKGR